MPVKTIQEEERQKFNKGQLEELIKDHRYDTDGIKQIGNDYVSNRGYEEEF